MDKFLIYFDKVYQWKLWFELVIVQFPKIKYSVEKVMLQSWYKKIICVKRMLQCSPELAVNEFVVKILLKFNNHFDKFFEFEKSDCQIFVDKFCELINETFLCYEDFKELCNIFGMREMRYVCMLMVFDKFVSLYEREGKRFITFNKEIHMVFVHEGKQFVMFRGEICEIHDM